MSEKRFTTDNGSNEDVCLVDNLTKKEYESNFNDIVDLMNKTWEQTRRFEKHNQYLEKENEQLKQQLKICKDARQSYKQDWKSCVSYCDTYKDEIHTLKDNVQGLIEENKQLKQSNKDAWNLIQFIYNEIKEDGYMDWGRIQDLVEF